MHAVSFQDLQIYVFINIMIIIVILIVDYNRAVTNISKASL